jgi:UDP-GlcNAc:undecaprenyl-phosphate GlcNAc-1-phosphate transferase
LSLLAQLEVGMAVFLGSAALTYILAHFVRIMDLPNARSSHSRPVPKSGGIAIVTTFVGGSLVVHFSSDFARIDDGYFWGFIMPAAVLAAISLIDDILQKTFWLKIFVQVLCTGAVLGAGVVLERIAIPLWGEIPLSGAGYVLTFVWVLGLTNAYNFMDGLDGLAAGVALIAAAFLCAIAFEQKSLFVYISSYVLLASVAGFLLFNFPPAKIFMGDVGSAFLGFTFATLAVIGASPNGGHLSFYIVPLLLFHFIFDTVLTFFRRLLRGEKVHSAHRTHLYQLLNRLGYSHRSVSLFHYLMTALQGSAAFVSIGLPADRRLLLFLPFLVFEIAYARWVLRRAKAAGLI